MDLKKIIIVLVMFLVGVLVGGQIIDNPKNNDLPETQSQLAQVSFVIDGDTIVLENNQRVRLLGLDTPEKNECFYSEARDYLISLVDGETVRLEKDLTDMDKYDRLLRYVILPSDDKDDILVNELLVRNGYALTLSISPDIRYRDLFSSAQEEAKREQRGLWGVCGDLPETNEAREQDSDPPSEECNIKGNISEKGFGKTYLFPGCDNYNTVKIDPRKGEQYFCSTQEAAAAGYRQATNCP
jgi:micrococcal nuclease